MKLPCENFQFFAVFEISQKTRSGYFHAGRMICDWDIQSKKRFLQKSFSNSNNKKKNQNLFLTINSELIFEMVHTT